MVAAHLFIYLCLFVCFVLLCFFTSLHPGNQQRCLDRSKLPYVERLRKLPQSCAIRMQLLWISSRVSYSIRLTEISYKQLKLLYFPDVRRNKIKISFSRWWRFVIAASDPDCVCVPLFPTFCSYMESTVSVEVNVDTML